jgi:hypothetical protein
MAGAMLMLTLALGIPAVQAQYGGGAAAFMLAAAAAAPPTTGGAFDALSPGSQKIVRALYEAQQRSTGATRPPLTLDQIAARKQSGRGWGDVFNTMKSQHLVQDKNLGQVISNHERALAKGRDTSPGARPAHGKGRAVDLDNAPSASIGDTGGRGRGVGGGVGHGRGK